MSYVANRTDQFTKNANEAYLGTEFQQITRGDGLRATRLTNGEQCLCHLYQLKQCTSKTLSGEKKQERPS